MVLPPELKPAGKKKHFPVSPPGSEFSARLQGFDWMMTCVSHSASPLVIGQIVSRVTQHDDVDMLSHGFPKALKTFIQNAKILEML